MLRSTRIYNMQDVHVARHTFNPRSNQISEIPTHTCALVERTRALTIFVPCARARACVRLQSRAWLPQRWIAQGSHRLAYEMIFRHAIVIFVAVVPQKFLVFQTPPPSIPPRGSLRPNKTSTTRTTENNRQTDTQNRQETQSNERNTE